MIFDVQTGAGREGLPKNKMDNILIALLPIEEQALLVNRIKVIEEYLFLLEKEISKSEENSRMLMESVLKEAFN